MLNLHILLSLNYLELPLLLLAHNLHSPIPILDKHLIISNKSYRLYSLCCLKQFDILLTDQNECICKLCWVIIRIKGRSK